MQAYKHFLILFLGTLCATAFIYAMPSLAQDDGAVRISPAFPPDDSAPEQPVQKDDAPAEEEIDAQQAKPEEDMFERLKKEQEKDKVAWNLHKSVSETFDAKFPREYKYKIFPFQFNEDRTAMGAEIISNLDGSLSSDSEKSILIKSLHTWGIELSVGEMKKILKDATDKYIYSAQSINGKVISNEDINHKGFFGKDIYITYFEEGEKYGLRIRIYTTNFAKVEQVLSGPADIMYSYRANDFFDSIILYDGILETENELGYQWKKYTSPDNVFTVTLPPINNDYTPKPPAFKTRAKSGAMRFEIADPVMEYSSYYNVYNYVASKPLTYNTVKALLFNNHVTKFLDGSADQDSINIKSTIIDGMNFMKIRLIISPPDKLPHINTLVYELRYVGNMLVIQEFLCNDRYANAGLEKALFSKLDFHPEKYKPVSSTNN